MIWKTKWSQIRITFKTKFGKFQITQLQWRSWLVQQHLYKYTLRLRKSLFKNLLSTFLFVFCHRVEVFELESRRTSVCSKQEWRVEETRHPVNDGASITLANPEAPQRLKVAVLLLSKFKTLIIACNWSQTKTIIYEDVIKLRKNQQMHNGWPKQKKIFFWLGGAVFLWVTS